MSSPQLELGTLVPEHATAIAPGNESITGQHVTLERVSPTSNNLPGLYASVGRRPELWTFLPEGPFRDEAHFTETLTANMAMPGIAIYAVMLHPDADADSEIAGLCTLVNWRLEHRAIEGGLLYGPSLQKTRAGTEAMYLLGKLVFDTLGYRRLEWRCDVLNGASRGAAGRYGFVYEGMFRKHMIVRGRDCDSCWYAMLDGEWEGSCQKGFEGWLADENFDQDGRQKRRLEDVRKSIN